VAIIVCYVHGGTLRPVNVSETARMLREPTMPAAHWSL